MSSELIYSCFFFFKDIYKIIYYIVYTRVKDGIPIAIQSLTTTDCSSRTQRLGSAVTIFGIRVTNTDGNRVIFLPSETE